MKTDDLIGMLAREAGPASRSLVARRFGPVFALAFPAAILLALANYDLVPPETFSQAGWWIKLLYAIGVTALALPLAARLGRPGSPLRRATLVLTVLIILMLMLGLSQWVLAAPGERTAVLMGQSWEHCSLSILLVSLPALGLGLWAMRGLAPTRPVLAGAVTGLLAGGIGAAAYALTCEEVTMTFVAFWYTLGMLLPAMLGAIAGRKMLRW